MWEELEIETYAFERFIRELGPTKGSILRNNYQTTRINLVEDILPEIKTREGGLTDHGPKHIANVLKNIELLLGADGLDSLNACELYCLLTSVLLHDVGNIHKRENHQKNITTIYSYVRPGVSVEEKRIVTRIVGAHAGCNVDGSKDTLKTLNDTLQFMEKGVKVGDLAALLRFADELAEGPQRTSKFMMDQGYYPYESEIYHKYASMTNVYIDKGNSRIVLTYHLHIKNCMSIEDHEKEINDLLEYSYKRIIKMDQERKFNKFYCTLLSTFKKIEVSYILWVDGCEVDLGLGKLVLDDLVVPGETEVNIEKLNKAFIASNILEKINNACLE